MERIKKRNFKDILTDSSLLRTTYFLNLFMSTIVFLEVAAVIIDGLIMIWAFFVLKNTFIKNRQILKINHAWWLIFFVVSSVFTTIIQLKVFSFLSLGYGLVMVYHFAMCFFIFYGMHAENSYKKLEHEILTTLRCIVTATTIFTILSFAVMLVKSSIDVYIPAGNLGVYEHIIGIYQTENVERFTGLYVNPNIVAFCSVVAIIFCHVLAKKGEFLKMCPRWLKISALVLCISINAAALILSDSLASFILLNLYIVLVLFYNLVVCKKIFKGSMLASFLVFILVSSAFVALSVMLKSGFQDGMANFMNDIYSVFAGKDSFNGSEDVIFGRTHYDLENGNGRTTLLRQAFVIFKNNPIFGIGAANIEKYGDMYFDTGIAFPNFHNGYVSVLVCYGLVGFIFFVGFLFLLLKDFLSVILKFRTSLEKSVFPNILCVVLAYIVYSLLEKTMLSEINYIGVFFWLMLGYASVCMKNIRKDYVKVISYSESKGGNFD